MTPSALLDTRPRIAADAAMSRPVVHNVQLLRFVAATAVVIGHAADRLIPHAAHPWFRAVPWTAGVDLFFVISGFVMMLLARPDFGRPGAARRFLVRRLVRIVPPYWFFTAVTIAVVLAAGGRLGGTAVDPAGLAASLAFLPWPRGDGQLVPILSQGWTLNHEMVFYVAFAAALLARRGAALLAVGLAALALVHPLAPGGWFALGFWTRPIILEFVAGMALARVYLTGFRLPPAGAVAGIALAVLAVAGLGPEGYDAPARVVRWGIPAVLLAASVILLPGPARGGPLHRFVRLGGDASYALYLSHYMIVVAVASAWPRLAPGLPWVGVALALAASLTTAIVFFHLVERPVTDRLQRRVGDRRPSWADEVAP